MGGGGGGIEGGVGRGIHRILGVILVISCVTTADCALPFSPLAVQVGGQNPQDEELSIGVGMYLLEGPPWRTDDLLGFVVMLSRGQMWREGLCREWRWPFHSNDLFIINAALLVSC